MDITDKRQKNTDNFLKSYYIRKTMSQVSGYDETLSCAVEKDTPMAAIRFFDCQLESGQIRLLADLDDITYILLLQRDSENSFMTAAFSHYDFPATDKEMQIDGYSGAYLNTVQLWNTRTLQDDILQKSWLCGTLPETVYQDVCTFINAISNNEAIPEHILDKTGTAVTDNDDVRWDYMAEEKSFFSNIDAINKEFSILDCLYEYSFPQLWEGNKESLAAGDEENDVQINCRIYEHDEFVTLTYSFIEETLWISIFLPDRSGLSSQYDGMTVIDPAGNTLGVINAGQCQISGLKNFDGSIGIKNADGNVFIFAAED